MNDFQGLIDFNRGTPKNLYHFDAPKYDLDALDELKFAANVIPFAKRVRLMLDVGAGGGSLSLLLKRKYDVQSINTAFPDWPYCEYITERGSHCILIDVMESLPFSQRSFDLLHVSWVYHGQYPNELYKMFHELNRVLRPGGFLWMRGGWSTIQVEALKDVLINQLGYTILKEKVSIKPEQVSSRIFFGANNTLPYQQDWTVVLLKPIRAVKSTDSACTL